MDKLLNLAIDGVLDVFVKPGCNFGDLTKDEYERFCGQGKRRRGSTYELLNLLGSDKYLNNENEIIDNLMATLSDIEKEERAETEEHNRKVRMGEYDKPENKEPKVGNVYLMLNKRNNFYKIGFTKGNPIFRERTLQAQEPEVELIYRWTGSLIDEKELHKLFENKQERGEWFKLNKDDIQVIIDYFASIK